MSNSVFQSVIVQLKDATDRVLGVMDAEGCVVACTDVALLGERWADAAVKVAASLEPGSHFHFLSLSSFSSSLCLVFQNVIGRVHPDRAGL